MDEVTSYVHVYSILTVLKFSNCTVYMDGRTMHPILLQYMLYVNIPAD